MYPFKIEDHLDGEPVFYSKPLISRYGHWNLQGVRVGTLKTYIWEPRGWGVL